MRKRCQVIDLTTPKPRRKRRMKKPSKKAMKYLDPMQRKGAEVAARNNHQLGEWTPANDVGNVLEAVCRFCGRSLFLRRQGPKDEMPFFGPCNWNTCSGPPKIL